MALLIFFFRCSDAGNYTRNQPRAASGANKNDDSPKSHFNYYHFLISAQVCLFRHTVQEFIIIKIT